MNIKQLERSQKIYLEIKKLDAEIIEIDKVAQLIANGNAEVNLTLSVKDTTPKKEVKQAVTDEDGSLKSGPLLFEMRFSPISDTMRKVLGMSSTNSDDEDNRVTLKSELSENLAFNVLAIMLHDKQTKRNKLINSLKKIGVQLT